MSSELIALAISAGLIATAGTALLARKVSDSLISLFYSALILGVAFTYYGDALLGLLTMVTFAGAVSVLLLSVVLMTGESRLEFGARRSGLLLAGVAVFLGVFSVSSLFPVSGVGPATTDASLSVITFAWTLRPWDLLILMVVFAAAMVSVAGLFGREN